MKMTLALLGLLLACTSSAQGQDEAFRPLGEGETRDFYASPERSVQISVDPAQLLHDVPEHFLGINMSYFNTTDEIWAKYDLTAQLQAAGVGALRYPGGEETSFFHWRQPGVNGYEDAWDPPEQHGTAPGRGKFQTTWVDPAKWPTNEDFMNFDEFMQVCAQTGAEPLVGLNLSSARKHDRKADGLAEALEWMRYCREKNYQVTYWYLDNEPWNNEANYTFQGDEYLDDIVEYGTAIKREFPEAKLIINPTTGSNYYYWDWLEKIFTRTGPVIDYFDVHWYWGWGTSSFDNWIAENPLTTQGKWTDPAQSRPFVVDIPKIYEAARRAGAGHVGVVVLEWNIAPSEWSQTFNESLIAVMQADVLLNFLQANVRMTCLWPLLWQSSREAWPEQDVFPSIITQAPPFRPTLSREMFRMLAPVQGSNLVKCESPQKDIVTIAGKDPDGKLRVYVINKFRLRRKVTLEIAGEHGEASAETIAVRSAEVSKSPVAQTEEGLALFVEPYSFTAVTIN